MKKILSKLLICSTIYSLFFTYNSVLADAETQINGNITSSAIDISASSEINYMIDGKTLTSDSVEIINNSNFPITVGVADVEKTIGTIQDVLPDEVGSQEQWFLLGRAASNSKIALGLQHSSGEYLEQYLTDTLYFRSVQDSENPIYLGAISAASNIGYQISGFYGLSFDTDIQEQYKIIWNIGLYEGATEDSGGEVEEIITPTPEPSLPPEEIVTFSDETTIVERHQMYDGYEIIDDYSRMSEYANTGLYDSFIGEYILGTVKISDEIYLGDISSATNYTVPNYIYNDEGVYKVVEYGDNIFNFDSNLNKLIIPYGIECIGANNFIKSTDDYIDYLIIPDSITSIGDGCFNGNGHNITNIIFYNGDATGDWREDITVLPYDDESKQFLSTFDFDYCINQYIGTYLAVTVKSDCTLKEITVPSNFKGFNIRLTSNAFNNNKIVESIYLYSMDESLTSTNLFQGCTALKQITISENISYMDKKLFSECTNLNTIYYKGTATGSPWGATNATVITEF